MAMKRKVLAFLAWLAFVLVLYRMPVRLTASEGYPWPTWPYPGPGHIYVPLLQQAGIPNSAQGLALPVAQPTETPVPARTP